MGKEYGILQILNRIFDYTNSLIRTRLAGNVVSEVTLQNAATANGNGTPITLDGNASLVVQITGTFVATVNFEVTQDGTNYVGILGQNVNTGGQETSATAPGIFVFSVNGLNKFRARISGYTSGSITVKAAAIAVPLAGLSSATINATVDAVKVKDATGTYTWNIGSDGAGPVQLTGSIESIASAPVVGVKTVTSIAAEIFAGTSAKANRRKLILKNEDPILRFRIGPSTVTQQNGFPVEPGAVVEIQFDPATAVSIYAISEGPNLQVAVMEV